MKPRNLFGFGASFTLAAIYSRSLHSRRRPRRSCAAAKTGRGTAFALGFPIDGSLFNALPSENEIQPLAGRNPASQVEILSSFGRNLRATPADGKARRTFVLRALFTLAAIYSRSLHSRRRPRRSCAAAKTGRGTCRPTRRPTAVRAAGQTAQRFAPAPRG